MYFRWVNATRAEAIARLRVIQIERHSIWRNFPELHPDARAFRVRLTRLRRRGAPLRRRA